MKSWVNLHSHGRYSILDGAATYEAYANKAISIGSPAISVTEHGNLHGWLDFLKACEAADGNLKALLGCEMYQARKSRFDRDDAERASSKALDDTEQKGPHHLIVFARNNVGYKNMIKLSSESYLSGYYVKPRIDLDLLSQYSEGLVVLSGCLNGQLQQALLRDDFDFALKTAATMQEIVGKDNYYIEVQNHDIDEQKYVYKNTVDIANRIGAKIVATQDSHYVNKEDADIHDLVLCVSTAANKDDENRFRFHGSDFYFKSYDEMAKLFPEEWLSNTLEVAEKFELDLKFGEFFFPQFKIPTNEDTDIFLHRLVWEGAKRTYGEITKEIEDRIEYELGVITRMGFQHYFLVVQDLVNFARSNRIRVGVGRGSAAGCCVGYCLGITGLDPLRWGLPFERFLDEGRNTMPDIDLDFDERYRELVVEYARLTYGDDRVANICTFSRIQARAALRDAARVLGYDYQTGDTIAKSVPPPVLGISKTLDEALASPELAALCAEPDNKRIFDAAKGLEGTIRQTGMHAAGIVIAQDTITNFVPVMRKGEGEPVITQWHMKDVEQVGLLKVDFLGLRNLTVVDLAIKNEAKLQLIPNCPREENGQIDFYNIPLDDPDVYRELAQGNNVGVFQVESSGLQSMAVAMKPDRFEDIMALISLYRPGPLGSNMDKMYINRKHGREKIESYHPKLDSILQKSYGIMLYQEDVTNVTKTLADFTVSEADLLRKAIGKKELDKIGKYRKQFVDGCKKASNIDATLANKIYSAIEYFGGYGFNLSHACSYAHLCYVTAYLKIKAPAPYMAALMSTIDSSEARMGTYLNECRRLGVTVKTPSLNYSEKDFTVISPTEILYGFHSIKGLGPVAVKDLTQDRPSDPYQSIQDFFRRTKLDVLNKKNYDHLIDSGCLDELMPEQEGGLSRDDKLFLLDAEREELGTFISAHPLTDIWHNISEDISTTIEDIKTSGKDKIFVTLGGIMSNVTKKTTKRGDPMAIFSFEDLTGGIEVIAFTKVYSQFSATFKNGNICILSGIAVNEGDEETPLYRITLKSVRVLKDTEASAAPSIVLKASGEYALNYDIIEGIETLIDSRAGQSYVFLDYETNGRTIRMQFKKPTSLDVKPKLEQLINMVKYAESIG